MREISRFITKERIDVLHAHDLYMSRAAFLGIRSSGRACPLIVDLHENYPQAMRSYNWTRGVLRNYLSNPDWWIGKEEEYLKYADELIVLSDDFKDQLIRKFKSLTPERITALPNVIDFERFDKFTIDRSVKRSDQPTLLYFGMVAERRGIFDTLSACHQLAIEGVSLKLLVIGPIDKADSGKFWETIEALELKKVVEYIPWIQLSELLTYLHISDISLAPFKKNDQHESGVANKIYQYMYGRKPIVASDCKPQKDLIESCNCGLIYQNQEGYVKALKELIVNEDLRTSLGENGYTELRKRFDSEIFRNKLIEVYEGLTP